MKRLLIPALLAATLAHASGPSPQDTPLDTLPYTPTLDVTVMDRTVDPCEDLYRFACGAWSKTNPIPADESRWSVYAKMANEMYLAMKSIPSDGGSEAIQFREGRTICRSVQSVDSLHWLIGHH